jgi:hypothetical protein
MISDSAISDFCVILRQNIPERGATMRAGISAAIIAGSVMASGAACADCKSIRSRDCVNLDLVPQISEQIVGAEHIAAPQQNAPAASAIPAYTGPIFGVSPTVKQAPTVGYRWAIN